MPTLMISISGIRGIVGDGLDPEVLVNFTSAYADFVSKGTVVVGRDARISGEMVQNIVTGTLIAKGLNVVDIGICPTPTVQLTVKKLKAAGGIAISASHNPNEWNALKLLNNTGQFMTPDENKVLMKLLDSEKKNFNPWNQLGKRTYSDGVKDHIKDVLNLKYIDVKEIRKRKFKVLADCVNGAGVYVIPDLLKEFGCEVIEMNCEKTGIFPRFPEPLPENLTETMKVVKKSKADLGVVVDPDVDRLVLITNEGEPFSEENTITQAVKFILSKKKGNVVVNLSTTRAVDDVAEAAGCKVYRSSVGEANVVKKMKEVDAVIGGEGSGGVIYPALHYGRDALVGIAITLQHLSEFGKPISELKKSLPDYFIAKKKIELGNIKPDDIINSLVRKYKSEKVNTEDGLRIDFADHWVHFRKSNTEPIVRIITEAKTKAKAEELSKKYFEQIKTLL
ncbi:MAG: phosphoglucosamine mutase [Ignavibacteria bacterium GWA2_35_9]|nr:MAG: phosphoglucosamine mutase [Ignavibacteria bacterium GWA2_35_9]